MHSNRRRISNRAITARCLINSRVSGVASARWRAQCRASMDIIDARGHHSPASGALRRPWNRNPTGIGMMPGHIAAAYHCYLLSWGCIIHPAKITTGPVPGYVHRTPTSTITYHWRAPGNVTAAASEALPPVNGYGHLLLYLGIGAVFTAKAMLSPTSYASWRPILHFEHGGDGIFYSTNQPG